MTPGADNSTRSAESLGWNGIASVAILLVAGVSLGNWLPASSTAVLLLRLVWVALYLAAAGVLLRRFGRAGMTWMLRRQPALCLLLLLACLSSLWSIAPLISFQKALSVTGTTMLGVFIGYTCSSTQIMNVLRWVFALLVVLGILAVVGLPAPESLTIGWRGVMGHKNTFGALAGLATVYFLVVTQRRDLHPASGVTLGLLSLVVVVQARSRTSVVALGVTLAVFACLSLAAGAHRPALVTMKRLAAALVISVSVLPFVVGPLAAALGNSDPLNGRTRLWESVATMVRERPLTGYGYEVVWARGEASLLPHVAATVQRSAASAHNSILHIASELGLVGALVACLYLFAALVDAALLWKRAPSSFSLFVLLFVVGIAVSGFAEAHLLRIHSIFWILFVALTVGAKRSLERLAGGASAERPSS